jgi:hypothetical protein
VQLSVGSRWHDGQRNQFVVDVVDKDGTEVWVSYTRVGDQTSYRCLAEAFTERFQRVENES